MVVSQLRSKRRKTGGRYKSSAAKKMANRGNLPTLTKLGEQKVRVMDSKGNNVKRQLMSGKTANVFDPKGKKYFKEEIKNIVESPANRNYVRRNIMTKGTVIETSKGKAKITSRPGQEGNINAVLM